VGGKVIVINMSENKKKYPWSKIFSKNKDDAELEVYAGPEEMNSRREIPEARCVYAGPEFYKRRKYCSSCGFPVDKADDLCPKCGAPIEKEDD